MIEAIAVPGIQSFDQIARFYKADNIDYVEISFVGEAEKSKNTLVQKVKPEHMARFRAEWDAYCDGRPLARRDGTPLTDVMDTALAERFINGNVHNLEEFSQLNDMQCQGFGHGTRTMRDNARKLMGQRQMEMQAKALKTIADMSAKVRPMDENTEIAELRKSVEATDAKLEQMMAMLTTLTAPKPAGKRGPKPKIKPEPDVA